MAAPPGFPAEGTPKEIEEYLERTMKIIPFRVRLSEMADAYRNEFGIQVTEEDMKEVIQVFGESLEQTLGCNITLMDDGV